MIVELLAVSAMTFGEQASSEPEGCSVAVRYVERLVADDPGRWVFNPQPDTWSTDLDRPFGGAGPVLDAAFREKIEATPARSAVESCGSLRELLVSRGIPHSLEAVSDAVWENDPEKFSRLEPFQRAVVTITLPVMNDNQSEAFVQVGVVAAPQRCAFWSYTLDVTQPDLPVTRRFSGPIC
ncbi:hypothetical protein [Brevundimonas sp. FT23042]|uniref:hypothetical protein n=1 Tax=Brevundimonas sp. FT23042 TaxID=3393749 RepID=UPI003B589008